MEHRRPLAAGGEPSEIGGWVGGANSWLRITSGFHRVRR
jgi:hypothetical protein